MTMPTAYQAIRPTMNRLSGSPVTKTEDDEGYQLHTQAEGKDR